jgi:hypothetical protein
MKKLLFALLIAVIAAGCISLDIYVANNRGPKVERSDSALYIKSYVIGVETTAYIGQPIARWQAANRHSTITQEFGRAYIEFENDFRLTGKYSNKLFTEYIDIKGVKGDKREVIGETYIGGEGEYHVINAVNDGERNTGKRYGLLIDNNGTLNTNIITDTYYEHGFVAKKFILYPPDAHFVYSVEKNPEKKVEETVRPFGESRELIFSGVNNVAINVTYREYTPDDLARQAFYQNLTYQPSAHMIRFQNFKIKVHEVTNEKIVFTVLEDGLDLPTP